MCDHHPVVCKKCGAKDWKLFKEKNSRMCNALWMACAKCNHTVTLHLERPPESSDGIIFCNVRKKPLAEITAADVLPGMDADDVAENPDRYIRI